MEKNVLISIIVPIYNVEEYLDRCLQSLIHQSYTTTEIILIDDESPDKCPAMCDNYAKVDKRIRVIHKKNGGLSDARNAGLDIASGDFVIFVDSDDYIEKDLCKTLVSNIQDNCDIYAYRFRRFYNDTTGDPFIGNGSVSYFYGDEIFDMYIKRELFTHMVCDKMFRLSLFKDVRFTKGRLAEDLALCYQLFGKAKGAAFIDKTFYNYYIRENSIMGLGTVKLCLDTYKGECEAYEYGSKRFPQYSKSNDVRFLNQSMKTYLKLLKRYGESTDDDEVKKVMKNILHIPKHNMPISTLLFYRLFNLNKSLAWVAFNILNLS